MKTCFIEPYAHLGEYKSDMYMVLPEGLHDSQLYYNFITNFKGYKILDNGIAEGDPVPYDELIGWAKSILKINEIVVPDYMGDAEKSRQARIEFFDWVDQHCPEIYNQFLFMGVAHGQTVEEILSSIQQLAMDDRIQTLGLPRVAANNISKHIRAHLVPLLVKNGETVKAYLAKHFPGGVHCLGMSQSFDELAELSRQDWIRSIDTSIISSASLTNSLIDGFWSFKRPDLFPNNFWEGTYPSPALARYNYETWLRGTDRETWNE